jgi:DNA-binding FadR family transcriptional regulator
LLAGLCLEPAWLAARLELSRAQAPEVLRALGLRRLLHLRCAGAALRVATEVERGLSGQPWREGHREALSSALLAGWDGVRAARDADAAPLAATVRGFAEGERLRAALRERFDEDWWRNPRTREHLAGLLAAGRLVEAAPPVLAEPSPPAPAGTHVAGEALARLLERGG